MCRDKPDLFESNKFLFFSFAFIPIPFFLFAYFMSVIFDVSFIFALEITCSFPIFPVPLVISQLITLGIGSLFDKQKSISNEKEHLGNDIDLN